MPRFSEKIQRLDMALVKEAKDIKVLSNIEWPRAIRDEFIKNWHGGNPKLPTVNYDASNLSDKTDGLQSIMNRCDRAHPIESFLFRSARSYLHAAHLIESAGTPRFVRLSVKIYGQPNEVIAEGMPTTRKAAEHLMGITQDFADSCQYNESDFCLMPETIAQALRDATVLFKTQKITVVVDPNLTAKAAAGASKIRIRGGTCFTEEDSLQLINHELYVHSLTALNGRSQANLQTLGLGPPRTTLTQEGLAIFGELISNSIDVNRLRRIASRSIAIAMAMEGADFLDVFRYFLTVGQSLEESYSSASRVFRGGDPRGKIVFTKDNVYLSGFVRVHSFMREAIKKNDIKSIDFLVAGRLAASDVEALAPFFESSHLSPPLYQPPWLKSPTRLAAFLLHSAFTSQLELDNLTFAMTDRTEDFLDDDSK
ncbi:MAG: hypothetical protein ACI97A_002591 [Planctomycetota bacterium]